MKILTKEQEAAHYNATLQGGLLGGFGGLAVGIVGVLGASRRYHFFRQLTLPLKAFLITSSGTFAGIVTADHYSRNFERENNPIDVEYQQREKQRSEQDRAGKTFTERAMDFGKRERYKIVGASWLASMFAAFSIVNRNKYLSGQQKLVQARVYAQFLTLGVLVATAAFEISDSRNQEGRYETIKVFDPKDPEHKRMIEKQRAVEGDGGDSLWKEMVAAEEERIKEREEDEKRLRSRYQKKNPSNESKSKKGSKSESKGKPSKDKDGDEDKEDDSSDASEETNKEKKDDKSNKDHHEIPSANDAKESKDFKKEGNDKKKKD